MKLKNSILFFSSFLLTLLLLGDTPSYQTPVAVFSQQKNSVPSFSSWEMACNRLPHGIASGAISRSRTSYENVQTASCITPNLFEQALEEFCTHAQTAFDTKVKWLDDKAPSKKFYNLAENHTRPIFVQKIELPAKSSVLFHGDLHGDVHAVVKAIADYVDDNFKLKDPNMYFIFLGDYVDRGLYGYECIYTLLRLKNANPDRVFFARGNHEDKDISSRYGFTQELSHKNIPLHIINKIFNWYALLPAAIYVGCNNNFLHCCHGCLELSYNPHDFLNAHGVNFHALPRLDSINGFMWNDAHVDPYATTTPGRAHGCVCSAKMIRIKLSRRKSKRWQSAIERNL